MNMKENAGVDKNFTKGWKCGIETKNGAHCKMEWWPEGWKSIEETD